MSRTVRCLYLLALAVAATAQAAGDYVGVLRPTSTAIAIPEPGFYWPVVGPFGGGLVAGPVTEGLKLKLGYRYSPYLSVETGFADSGWGTAGPLFAPATARAKGFSMDTVGTLPLWTHGALYGRLGAYRSGGAMPFLAGGEGNLRAGSGLRYGLGLKYNVTGQFGVQAEMERFAPLDRWRTRESDTDQVSVGVSWRF